jgi:hypothetical protein
MSPQLRRGSGDSMHIRGRPVQHGKPHHAVEREGQPDAREGQAGRDGATERPAVSRMPGNDERGGDFAELCRGWLRSQRGRKPSGTRRSLSSARGTELDVGAIIALVRSGMPVTS